MKYLNVECGDCFLNSKDWLNLDYSSNYCEEEYDLSRGSMFDDEVFELVYSSHFLEHLSLEHAKVLLSEFFRVLRPGARVRIVLPDLENIAREYIKNLDARALDESFFNVIEIVD